MTPEEPTQIETPGPAPVPGTIGSQAFKSLPSAIRARKAIEGMGQSDVHDAIERIEAQFPVTTSRRAIELLYLEIEFLALGYAKVSNDLRAREVQEQFYKTYTTMVDEHRELRAFLFEHFNDELGRGTSMNMPLLAICKGIMLDGKKAKV